MPSSVSRYLLYLLSTSSYFILLLLLFSLPFCSCCCFKYTLTEDKLQRDTAYSNKCICNLQRTLSIPFYLGDRWLRVEPLDLSSLIRLLSSSTTSSSYSFYEKVKPFFMTHIYRPFTLHYFYFMAKWVERKWEFFPLPFSHWQASVCVTQLLHRDSMTCWWLRFEVAYLLLTTSSTILFLLPLFSFFFTQKSVLIDCQFGLLCSEILYVFVCY